MLSALSAESKEVPLSFAVEPTFRILAQKGLMVLRYRSWDPFINCPPG